MINKKILKLAGTLSVILLGTIFLTSCSHHTGKKKSKVEQNVAIGINLKANRFDNLYFSEQPTHIDLKNLKSQGFTTVINLRGPKEYDEKLEKKIITESGLNYYNIPFYKKSNLSNEYIDKVTKKIMKHRRDGKLLVHCSSGNRVGIWLGGHFFKDHGLSKEKSLKMARDLGLTKKSAEKKLRKFLYK